MENPVYAPYAPMFRLWQRLHNTVLRVTAACLCIVALRGTVAAQGDDPPAPIASRAEAIEVQREQKASNLTPETQLEGERVVDKILENPIVKALSAEQPGLDVKVGGLITGSGISAGPEYLRRDLYDDRIIFRAWASGSIKQFWLAKTDLEIPNLVGNWLFADFSASHRGYPEINYFGPGPSSPDRRTSWALKDNWLSGTLGVRPFRHTQVGVIGRYLTEVVGPGKDARGPTDQAFTPETTPGLLGGSNFVQAGSFLQFDYRDNPGEAHNGGLYWIDFSDFSDLKFGRYSFGRVNAEAQQYIPLPHLNGTHVIALRARTSFSDAHSGDAVPFYLQSTLGGPDTLRGYEAFRFYDNNSVILNGEYRWKLYDGLDGALFADAGKVFPRWQQINLDDLQTSYGFGLRFLNGRGQAIVRLDVGFSREGFAIWFKFGNIFGNGFRNLDNLY